MLERKSSALQNPNTQRVHEIQNRERGQSMVELALLLPILVMILSVAIEGGLALNSWIRVNTAARDATRFEYDTGPADQTAALVLDKLAGIDFGASGVMTGSRNLD